MDTPPTYYSQSKLLLCSSGVFTCIGILYTNDLGGGESHKLGQCFFHSYPVLYHCRCFLPLLITDTGSHTATEQSDTSSFPGETESGDSSSWSETLGLSELEQVSAELANKGPAQSELELRLVYI